MRNPGTLEKNHNFANRKLAKASGPCQRGNAPKNAKALRHERNMPHRDDTDGPNGEETPDSAAHYIAAIAGELAKIARRNGLDTLGTILEMARLEADHLAKH
jgi:hypothetical protein